MAALEELHDTTLHDLLYQLRAAIVWHEREIAMLGSVEMEISWLTLEQT